ncbi:hypothetical protein [Chitinilyticum aquatile]|uniref:hypothetical protein n=1 Tax=Chitinilyticum aquatile TaxID=362520 RepID=UPI0004207165|nr:hypothetical protein [Chitinilyticum aquatile]
MERNQFGYFAGQLKLLGEGGIDHPYFTLGRDRDYELRYIPFEYVNQYAQLVIVGITPGNNQLSLAYSKAQQLIQQNRSEDEILREIKMAAAFGGSVMRPNLLKLLRHFRFDRLLGINDVETLWGVNAHLLDSTSVIPHVTFKAGKMFAGSFNEILGSPLLSECFLDCFVPSVCEMPKEAMFVGLGPCPQAALEWCVNEGMLQQKQVLGAFCHPSSAGGSTTRYYLREIKRSDLAAGNPVIHRCDWLDAAYSQMKHSTDELHARLALAEKEQTPSPVSSRAPFFPTQQPAIDAAMPSPAIGTSIHGIEQEHDALMISEAIKYGYTLKKMTKKIVEFSSPAGQIIYLIRTNSSINNIKAMVHPAFEKSELSKFDGIESISDDYRYHSNMTGFPKKKHKGETETAYGWQIELRSFNGLAQFLASFKLATP